MKKHGSVSSKRISTGSRGFSWAAALLGVFLACYPIQRLAAADCYIFAPGCLDPSFGAGTGKVTTNAAMYTTWASNGASLLGAVVDSLGRVVTAGSTINPFGGTQYLAMARYNADGTIDTTFGSNGNGIVISSTPQWINAVALEQVPVGGSTEEEIVVAGNYNNNFFIARYLTNGTLDPAFGTNGQTTVSFGSTVPSSISALAVQSDGNIMLVGSAGGTAGVEGNIGTNLAMARLTIGGVLDTSFGSGGKLTSTLPGGAAVVIQPADGKIIVGGSGTLSNKGKSSEGFVVARFLTNGAPDTTFGSGGAVLTTFAGSSTISALALDSTGRVVASGRTKITSGHSSSSMMAIARYTTVGKLDTSFDKTGTTTTYYPGGWNFGAAAVAIQPSDQKILVAGSAGGGGIAIYGIARFNSDGTLDTSFGAGDGLAGFVGTTFMGGGGGGWPSAIALDPNTSTFVVAGIWMLPGSNVQYFALARYFQ